MKNITYLLIFFCISVRATARQQDIPLSISLFNNGTSLPGTGYAGVFSKTIHPGITIGTRYTYKTYKKTAWFQTLKLGLFYHQHAQTGLQLYTELGYRYFTKGGLYVEGLIGAGYLHSFPDLQQFTLEDGSYKRKNNLGRPQFMGSGSLLAGYDFMPKTTLPLRLFLQYQFWIQTPFVNKYVPMLPNTAIHLGVVYTIGRKPINERP